MHGQILFSEDVKSVCCKSLMYVVAMGVSQVVCAHWAFDLNIRNSQCLKLGQSALVKLMTTLES